MKPSLKIRILIMMTAAVFIVIAAAFFVYVQDYYHAQGRRSALIKSSRTVTVKEMREGYFFDGPGTKKAMIFYPGAKVEETAYAPLMRKLSDSGTDCFLVKMPFRLAVLGKNRAGKIIKDYSYDRWIMAGHSLGGVMACSFAADNENSVSDIVLFASYPDEKIPENMRLLLLRGENDGVLDIQEYEESRTYWPENSTQYVVKGGNHAGFGMYGKQDNDGQSKVTKEEQKKAMSFLLDWLK